MVTPVLVAVFGFLVLPPVVKHQAEAQLGKLTGRRVSVGRVKFNPFSLTLSIDDFQVFEPDGRTPFLGFRRLFVNAQWESLYRRAPVVREVRLDSPRLHVVRLQATPQAWSDTTAYNFSDILARLSSPTAVAEPPPHPGDTPALFSINNIRITDGQFDFDDRPLASKHVISGFDLGIPFVSTLPTFIDTFVEPGLRLTMDGTPFALAGRTKPFKDSLETTIEVRITALDLTRYLPFVPVPLGFDVASALLDLNIDVSFVRPSSQAARLTARGRAAVDKVSLREKGGAPLVDLREFEVLVRQVDLTASSFDLERVTVAGLEVHARRGADGALNLQRLGPSTPPPSIASPQAARTPRGSAASSAVPRFTVGEIVLKDIVLHLRDETVRPPFTAEVDQIAASIRHLSNAPGARATMTLGLHAAPGGTLKNEGSITLTPLAAQGTMSLEGVEPGRFAPYFRDQIAFDVRQGRVRLGARYAVSGLGAHLAPARTAAPSSGPGSPTVAGGAPDIQIEGAFLEVAGLALRRRGASGDFFRLKDFAAHGVKVNPTLRAATIDDVVTHEGRVVAERDENGVIDLTTLVAAAPAAPGSAAPPKSVPVHQENPWSVGLRRLQVEGWGARFEDRMMRPKATLAIAPINVNATGLGTAPGTRGTVDVKVGLNNRGRLAVTGAATLEPLWADLRIDLRTLEILPLQPYFADQLNLVITDGTVSVKGRAKVEVPRPPAALLGRAPAAPGARVAFTGDIDLDSFASVDGSKHEEFLRWKSFHVGQLALTTVPLAVAIHDLALTDFYSRLVIFPDAHFNVQDILAQPAPADGAVATKAAPPSGKTPGASKQPQQSQDAPAESFPLSIGQVTLQGGHVSFSDRLIRPNYSAELTDLAGRISGLSADGSTLADVDIRGSVDHAGNLSIVGKTNPLAHNLFVDVKVNLKDFELPPTSSYAAKYAGYGISKGKLSLALDYRIADRKLDAKNRLVVEQFTFGDKVNSPDATNLPVRLAVALLKDRHGVIDIDLPIAGSLDSPDFKIGRAVLKVLGNLIVKAATAPFSMIASLFGGGDELSRVPFAPGADALDSRVRDKLASLGRALRERPGLSFEIEGGADPVRDREGLKAHLYERTLKKQKLLEVVQGGVTVSDPDPDKVRFDVAERPRLLEKAYRAATFPKPRNVLGRPKDLPSAEMEKLLMANTLVDDDALRALAERRASAVRESLARVAPEGAARLFLVAPRLSKPSEGPGHRVEFKLKKD
ncbi:MAG: DUF748 domain-containing protein [Polyangia bacterium]